MRETVNKEFLFSNYLYSSSTSGSLSKYFEQYTSEIISYLKLKPEDGYIIDLGSNDGITLQHFKNKGFNVMGVDPAQNLAEIANNKGIETINKFFDELVAQDILTKFGYPACILSSNTYAHLDNHQGFTNGVKILLNDTNCFVFENAALHATIKGLYFDQFYDNHLSYFWLQPLVYYFNAQNLKIVHVQRTPIQGGSIRVYVTRNTNFLEEEDSLRQILFEELCFGLDKDETYDNFWDKLQEIKLKFTKLINDYLLEGKTICCYGASAKFALFSKFFELNSKNVRYVVDDSIFKQGYFAPESKIPIVARDTFLDNPTDVCVISSWNFDSLIKENNKQYGGVFVNAFEL